MGVEVRELLRRRIMFSGEVHEIINALSYLLEEHRCFNRLCVEQNQGYDPGQGWDELVGYRDETEKEIEVRNKIEQGKKKSELRYKEKKKRS